jgi:hypothetical protein
MIPVTTKIFDKPEDGLCNDHPSSPCKGGRLSHSAHRLMVPVLWYNAP